MIRYLGSNSLFKEMNYLKIPKIKNLKSNKNEYFFVINSKAIKYYNMKSLHFSENGINSYLKLIYLSIKYIYTL